MNTIRDMHALLQRDKATNGSPAHLARRLEYVLTQEASVVLCIHRNPHAMKLRSSAGAKTYLQRDACHVLDATVCYA